MRHSYLALVTYSALAVSLGAAPSAFAADPPKPAGKPAPAKAAAAPAVAPSAAPAPTAAPPAAAPAPASSMQPAPPPPAAPSPPPPAVKPPAELRPPPVGDPNDPREEDERAYYFVGAKYRGNVVPQFWQNIFINEGGTFYSNTFGLEFEYRKNGFSIIPGLAISEYATSNPMLVLQKGRPDSVAGNWSLIDSSLKAVTGSVDFLWSKKLHKMLDFEFGFGVSVGATFGNLLINWVYKDPNGAYASEDGTQRFSVCTEENKPVGVPGCSKRDHSFAATAKMKGYEEPSWFNGGAKPSFLPNIMLQPLGLRFKPTKQFVARLQVGWSLTGFWFGIGGSYGLGSTKSVPKPNDQAEVIETVE